MVLILIHIYRKLLIRAYTGQITYFYKYSYIFVWKKKEGGASSTLGHAFQLEASPPQSWLRMFMLEKKVKIQCSQKANVQSHVRRARTAVSGIVGAYAGSETEVLSKPFLQTRSSSQT